MKRSLLGLAGSVAVLAFAAQPALADSVPLPCNGAAVPTGQVCFEYVADGSNGTFPYYDATGQILAPAASSAFAIFCVDQNDDSPLPGAEYFAYDTPLSPASGLAASFDGSFPPNHSGANDWQLYDEAAAIVDQWYADGQPLGTTLDSYQWAIWTVMGNGCAAAPGSSDCISNGGLATTLAANAQALSATQLQTLADNGQWGVITDAGKDCKASTEECQEFLFTTAPPTQVTPEPGTMSLIALGLAGMAGAGMRRRKRR